jgi:prefoldin subunit 5
METWKQSEENLGQPLESLQQSISELSKTIAAVEQELLPIEVQYSEVLKAATHLPRTVITL